MGEAECRNKNTQNKKRSRKGCYRLSEFSFESELFLLFRILPVQKTDGAVLRGGPRECANAYQRLLVCS
jgi:hypothetical protein